jgi:hypothetical protein
MRSILKRPDPTAFVILERYSAKDLARCTAPARSFGEYPSG